MKHFTQISKFAAMAAIAAIGISLYACEEKEKASKPTEAATPQETQKPVETAENVDVYKTLVGIWKPDCTDEEANGEMGDGCGSTMIIRPGRIGFRYVEGMYEIFSYEIEGDIIIRTYMFEYGGGEVKQERFKLKGDNLDIDDWESYKKNEKLATEEWVKESIKDVEAILKEKGK